MIAALVAAVLLQAMSQEQMILEGEKIGRAAAALGFCAGFGYTIDQEAAEHWGEDFGERAIMAGWSEAVVIEAIQSGTAAEMADINPPAVDPGLTDAEFVAEVTTFVEHMKARCRSLQVETPDLIRDIEAGDRSADEMLATIVRARSE